MTRTQKIASLRSQAATNAPFDAALAKRQIASATRLEAMTDAAFDAEHTANRTAAVGRMAGIMAR